MHFPETNGLCKGQEEELSSNFGSICYSLSSVKFRFLLIKAKKTIKCNFLFCFTPNDLDKDQHCTYTFNPINNTKRKLFIKITL